MKFFMCINEMLFCLTCLCKENQQSYIAEFCILCDMHETEMWHAQLYCCFCLLFCHGETNFTGCYSNLPWQFREFEVFLSF